MIWEGEGEEKERERGEIRRERGGIYERREGEDKNTHKQPIEG